MCLLRGTDWYLNNSVKSFSLKVLKWIFYTVVSPKKHKYLQTFTFPVSLQHAVRIGHLIWSEHRFLTLRLLMSYIYGAPILDVSRSHTTTQHSR